MVQNKHVLHQLVMDALKSVRETAEQSVRQAHEAATHEETVAENKYDTFGLEASYLAAGQSRRLLQAEADIQTFRKLPVKHFTEEDAISFGAYVVLSDAQNKQMHLFVSPVAGGLNVELDQRRIGLVSAASPLGKKLLGAFLGDDISINECVYEIIQIG